MNEAFEIDDLTKDISEKLSSLSKEELVSCIGSLRSELIRRPKSVIIEANCEIPFDDFALRKYGVKRIDVKITMNNHIIRLSSNGMTVEPA